MNIFNYFNYFNFSLDVICVLVLVLIGLVSISFLFISKKNKKVNKSDSQNCQINQTSQTSQTSQETIDAKNKLVSYVDSFINILKDDKLKDKFTPDDKRSIESKVDEIKKWLESNQSADTSDYENKYKDLESIINRIMQKVYQNGGMPGGMPHFDFSNTGGMAGASGNITGAVPSNAAGPKVEEVD